MATLSITFPAVTPTPSLGYRVKYWPTSNAALVTTATTATNSFTVSGLTATSYTGTVEASCGGGNYGSTRSFVANTVSVTGASASFQPCIGGTIDDFMGGQITVSAPVSVDTSFSIEVQWTSPGASCNINTNYRTTIGGVIPAGFAYATINPCIAGGQYIPGGGVICSAVGSI
jgi:predicted phage tail protein